MGASLSHFGACCVSELDRKRLHFKPESSTGPSDDTRGVEAADARLREGYLLTRDTTNAWRLRFFSLRSSGLYIFASHNDQRPRGFIPLGLGHERAAPEVSSVPALNQHSFQIFFDMSWVLSAGGDASRDAWLSAIASACVRPSNLESDAGLSTFGPPAVIYAGPLTRHLVGGGGRQHWAVLFEDGWLKLYGCQEHAEKQQPPKLQILLRSKRGPATARALSHVLVEPNADGSVALAEEEERGYFQLLCGLECYMCAETPEETAAWMESIATAIDQATTAVGKAALADAPEDAVLPLLGGGVASPGAAGDEVGGSMPFPCKGRSCSCFDRGRPAPTSTPTPTPA